MDGRPKRGISTWRLGGNKMGQLAQGDYDLLIWVSRNYYTPEDFHGEAERHGVSRRISSRKIPLNLRKGARMLFVFESEKDYEMRITKRKTPPHQKGKKPIKTLSIYGYATVQQVVYYADGTEDPAYLDKLRKKGVKIEDYYAAIPNTPIRGCGTIKPRATYLTELEGNIVWFPKPIKIKDKAWRGWKAMDVKRSNEIIQRGIGVKTKKIKSPRKAEKVSK